MASTSSTGQGSVGPISRNHARSGCTGADQHRRHGAGKQSTPAQLDSTVAGTPVNGITEESRQAYKFK